MISDKINKVMIGPHVLYHADCMDVLPTLDKVDAVVIDPPYPGQKGIVAKYNQCGIDFLNGLNCKQLIFWSASEDFPLDYTAIHIWDKRRGVQSGYERIFERHGNKLFRVWNYQSIISELTARFALDVYYGHPSQKPIALMTALIIFISVKKQTILDPFMGSGTTGVACAKLGRKFIGVEIERKYFDIACERIETEVNQLKLFD